MEWSTKTVADMYQWLVSMHLSWDMNLGSSDSSWSTNIYCPGAVIDWMAFYCLHWWATGTWSCLSRCILRILVAPRWLASWGLTPPGIIPWSWWRVILLACDTILGVLIGSVLLTGVLDWNQLRVWDPKVSMKSCTLSWWRSRHWFSPSSFWVWLGLLHPCCLEEWHVVSGNICADPILDGGVWPWR